MRKRIYQIIELDREGDWGSRAYNLTMLLAIVLSLLPLAFKESYPFFRWTDRITTVFFSMDYLLRWITSDFRMRAGPIAFAKYPLTNWALVDLLALLPSMTALNNLFKLLRVFRMIRVLRVLRMLRAMRYSGNMAIMLQVIRQSRSAFQAVISLALGYVLTSALIVFNIEPETFKNFFEAVYWATVSLTTVGYGDIYPVSPAGRVVAMLSSVFGIAIVALPAGIITAGYLEVVQSQKSERNKAGGSDELRNH